MENFFVDLSIILVGSAVLASLAVVLKQPVLLAYILCGILVGPSGIGWVSNVHLVENISHLGITLLLFLAGLYLHPQKLIKVFKKASVITVVNGIVSFIIGFVISYAFEFSLVDCLCIGLAMMFSSTILVVKLLPTTDLHHKHMGALCIGILILQDLLAVAVLAFIRCMSAPDTAILNFTVISAKLVVFLLVLVILEYYVLRRIMSKVERLHEALFILGLAWCFGVASISHQIGLFYETGAFFSGVVLARHRIAQFISEELKPLRDFFLVLFFFTLGARLDLALIKDVLLVSILLTVAFVIIRPLVLQKTFVMLGEKASFAKQAGIRLGQLSEFALLIAVLGLEEKLISNQAVQLIQLVTILTFVISSYVVFSKYPTPIGVADKLMKH